MEPRRGHPAEGPRLQGVPTPVGRRDAALSGLFVVLALLAGGWEAGVADHGIHVVFADLFVHPGRWRGDFLGASAGAHPSIFWLLQAPVTAVLPFTAAAAALHLGVLFATGWTVLGLARALGARDGGELLALAVAAVAWPALGGVDTMDPLLLPRGAALPLEVLAVRYLAEGRTTVAFAVAGAAISVHAPSGVACAAGLAAALAASGDRRSLGRGLVAVALGAAPVLVWWISRGGATTGAVDDAWALVLDRRMAHHLDPRVWPPTDVAFTVAVAGAGLIAPRAAAVRGFLVGAIAYGVVGVALGQANVALALQLEPAQAARLVVVVGGVSCAARGSLPATPAGVLALMLAATAIGRWSPDGERAHLRPGGLDGSEQAFARELRGLPEGSVVMVPPHRFADARVHGRRALFVTWKDGGEALFDRERALEWKRRVEVACACRPLDEPLPADLGPGERLAELRARMATGTRAAGRPALVGAARQEGVTHLVVEAGEGFELLAVGPD